MCWDDWVSPDQAVSIQDLLPQGPLESLLWIGVSVSAGICEEITFRGYFQRQFFALTGNRFIALLIQAVLFGIGHGYQGIQACLRIVLIGVMFGLLTLWRKSLRPAMMAHSALDIVSGILRV